jgi:hypothetical protein
MCAPSSPPSMPFRQETDPVNFGFAMKKQTWVPHLLDVFVFVAKVGDHKGGTTCFESTGFCGQRPGTYNRLSILSRKDNHRC